MKQTSKKNIKSAVAILLMLAVVITGAFAYFTASDSRNNVFTLGDVDVILHEDGWVLDENGDYIRADGTHEAILPGIPIEKAPYVENSGSNPAWAFVTVGVPTAPTVTDGNFQSYSANTNIPVTVYAIQDGYNDTTGDAEAIWNEFFAGEAENKFGAQTTKDVTEIFSLNELDTANWTQIGEAYNSADGYMYYVFAYNTMVEPDALTSKLFTSVTLDPELVGTESLTPLREDILFEKTANGVNVYSNTAVSEDEAASVYGEEEDFTFAGEMPVSFTPEVGDKYVFGSGYVAGAFTVDTEPDYVILPGEEETTWEVYDSVDTETSKNYPVPGEVLGESATNKFQFFRPFDTLVVLDSKLGEPGTKNRVNEYWVTGFSYRAIKADVLNYFKSKNIEGEIEWKSSRFTGSSSVATVTYPNGDKDIYHFVLYYDLDGDGQYNANDLTYASEWLLHPDVFENQEDKARQLAGDVNKNGIYDQDDYDRLSYILYSAERPNVSNPLEIPGYDEYIANQG